MIAYTVKVLSIAHIAFFCAGTIFCMENGEGANRRREDQAKCVKSPSCSAPATVAMNGQSFVNSINGRLQIQNDMAATFCCCDPLDCCFFTSIAVVAAGLVGLKFYLEPEQQ